MKFSFKRNYPRKSFSKRSRDLKKKKNHFPREHFPKTHRILFQSPFPREPSSSSSFREREREREGGGGTMGFSLIMGFP